MANLVKRIKKAMRKKRSADRADNVGDVEAYKKRVAAHKRRMLIRGTVVALVLIVIAVAGKLIWNYHSYNSYKVISQTEKKDAAATKYVDLDGEIFRYSANGASVVDEKEAVVWDKTYEMSDPQVDVCQDTVVVYEQQGNQIYIFNGKGTLGTIKTEMPVLKARVSRQGMVGVILEDGETTWLNFYSSDGSAVASCKTRIDSPGYPVDLSLSEDGNLIMVSYLYVDGNTTTSYVAFYNLTETGQAEMDNIVSGYRYKDVLTPEVTYLDASTAVAFRDDGFTVYSGNSVPEEQANYTAEKEIVSTFHDDSHIGIVTKSSDTEKQYTVLLFNTKGKLLFQKDFNIEYSNIKISNGQILMYNDTQVCIISMSGVEKFNGNIDEGKISDIFKTGINRYVVVLESGIDVIKLK